VTAGAHVAPVAAGRPSLGVLSALVFGAGTGTLAMEIAAARLLAPYFGASTIVWANVIGLTLASLSVGYWLGGRLADRRPDPRLLGGLVLGAGVLVATIPFVSQPFLDLTARGLDRVSAGAVVGSFLSTLLLFAPPIVVLGMVSPFAIRLAVDDVSSAGAIAGRLYALSTVGSLLGTFLSALVTIPLVGTQRTLLGSAAVLALTASLLLRRRWLLLAAAIALLLLVPPGAVKATPGLLHEEESTYQFVQVVERDGARRLYLNEGVAVHSLWRPDTVLTGGVWDTFLVPPRLLGRPAQRLAILGSAGGTVGRAFGVFYPEVEIDGVEIDAAVSRAGERWLGLADNPRVTTHEADARPFLRSADGGYDLIYADAYHQPYVPFYLATREFFELVRDRLAPGGIVALNVATVPGDTALPDAVGGTLASVFPQVLRWQALRFNQLVVGFTEPVAEEELARRLRGGDPRLAPLFRLFRDGAEPVAPAGRPWTDDRAPVEWITDRMIVEYGARGGRLDEAPLPTAPRR
jgi:spermidine synthase